MSGITRRLLIVFSLFVLSFLGGGLRALSDDKPETPAPKSPPSPADAMSEFVVHPQLKVELVAAEPEVIDPVAIRFDEDGRLWVVEMRDYPNGPKAGSPPLSRIKLLEDRDADGRYETAHLFADELLFATGIQPWRGGVIVTLAGRVDYLRDTDGDFRADVRETWFTGFAEQNPQLRANHPTFAHDNHIYVANGLRGGDVIARRKEWAKETQAISISGRDFRFDPHRGTYESVSGVGQFGLTFDDFGNRFVCSNRNPCKHVVLDDRYLKRNSHLAVSSIENDVSAAGEASRVYPISRFWTTSNLHEGQFTAACGVTIYRGDLLPAEFYGNSFTCEPTGNLVHRDVLRTDGATFVSRPGREKVEFLATRDEWFRPVNLANGPDGALYVVDMYRAVIEHPQWVPDELKNRPDERFGDDRGRIYRIVSAQESKPHREQPSLSKLSTAELVHLLDHPNAWQRETVFRLINERQDRSVVDELTKLVQDGKREQARTLALLALDGLGKVSRETVLKAIDDPHPRVQEQAVLLSEPFLKTDEELCKRVLKLAESEDARLRFQVALSLGEVGVERQQRIVADTIAAIAFHNPADAWTRTAAISSCADTPALLFESFLLRVTINNQWKAAGTPDFIRDVTEVIGSRQKKAEIEAVLFPLGNVAGLPAISPEDADYQHARFARLDGLARGLARRGKSLRSYIKELPKAEREQIDRVFRDAAVMSENEAVDAIHRRAAIDVLRHADESLAEPVLRQVAGGETPQALRLAALETLATFDGEWIGPLLLKDFAAQSPAVRRGMLDVLLANADRTRLLLNEVEAGRIRLTEFDPSRTNRLQKHRDAGIRARAQKLLAAAVPEDRKQVLAAYQPALALEANAVRGREVFVKNCTACHRIGEDGVNVAPDIADSRTRKPEQLLLNILDPNRAVDNNYFSYTVVTTEGKVVTGLLTAETASSVTLKQQEGKTATILRRDIEEMQSNGVSLMPVGLEKNINPQQMADLISFIKNWRYLDGRVPIKVD